MSRAPAAGRRAWLVVTGLVLAAALAGSLGAGLLGLGSAGGALDPRSATPAGTRALATLLARRGVHITLTTAPRGAPGVTTVLALPQELTAPELQDALRGGGPVVLLGADTAVLRATGLAVTTGTALALAIRPPRCALPVARVAGDAFTGGLTYEPAPDGCYAGPGGAAAAPLVTLPAPGGAGAATVTLLGDPGALTNADLATAGDAALAVGLLDQRPLVDWVLPVTPVAGAVGRPTRSLLSLLPRRVDVALLELGAAVVALALAAARRTSRLAPEPLPVAVPATETTTGRGRLYQAAGVRAHVWELLRGGLRARWAPRLGLTRRGEPEPAALVARIAERTGRDAAEIHELLYGARSTPVNDTALLRRVGDLDGLERDLTDHPTPQRAQSGARRAEVP